MKKKELSNDKITDVAHEIMKRKFTNPKINGFQAVLNEQHVSHFKKKKKKKRTEKYMVQILHRGSFTSGLPCSEGSVNVFDSMYTDLEHSKSQILSVLKHDGKHVKFHVIPVQHQVGGTDHGNIPI